MAKTLPLETQGEFENPPADTHMGVCYRLIDLGTQKQEWQGDVKFKRQYLISWELDCKMADGRPFSISRFYTWSMAETANLRIDLEAWRGVPFTKEDLGNFKMANLLGKACLIQVIHKTKQNGGVKAKIGSIVKLPKGMSPSPLVNPMLEFDLDEFDQKVYDSLSDGIRNIIAKSPEYAQAIGKSNAAVEEVMGHLNEHPPVDSYDEIAF